MAGTSERLSRVILRFLGYHGRATNYISFYLLYSGGLVAKLALGTSDATRVTPLGTCLY